MKEISEAEQDKMNEGRSLRSESQFLLPLLDTKTKLVCSKIVQAFKAGQYEALTAHAAELSTIFDMRNTITGKIKVAEAIERRIFEGEGNER